MATVHSTGTHLPIEIGKTLQQLEQLPPGWDVFVGWPDLDIIRPDLLVVSPEKQLFFVSATGAATDVLDEFDPKLPLTDTAPRVVKRVHRCVRALAECDRAGWSAGLVLVLTSADTEDLIFTFLDRVPVPVRCVNYTALRETFFSSEALRLPSQPRRVDSARASIAGPSTLQPGMTVHRHEADGKLRFLDQLQEEWLRRHLQPPMDAGQIAAVTGHHLLTGPAGCGKTLLLLCRAAFEHKLRPNVQPLVLTHNVPLLTELRAKAVLLCTLHGVPQFRTEQVVSWCLHWCGYRGEILKYGTRDALIREAIGASATREEVQFHGAEFAYIQDHIIEDFETYREFRRSGRTRALQPEQRRLVWERLQRYLQLLRAKPATDYPTFGLELFQAVRNGELTPPRTELIIIDEAQFLPPTLLGVLKLAAGLDGTLIAAADPTQGFLQRRSPWMRAGISFAGRTTRLKRPYRSTRAILQFAREFYLSRSEDVQDPEINLPTDEELRSSPDGPWPEVVPEDRIQDELAKTASAVGQLIECGAQPGTILVVPVESFAGRPILAALNAVGQRSRARWEAAYAKEAGAPNQVRVCTLDSATGLEAPYVVITGLRQMFEREDDPQLQQERSQLREDNTRRLYMAFTRAAFRLLLVWSGNRPPPFPKSAVTVGV